MVLLIVGKKKYVSSDISIDKNNAHKYVQGGVKNIIPRHLTFEEYNRTERIKANFTFNCQKMHQIIEVSQDGKSIKIILGNLSCIGNLNNLRNKNNAHITIFHDNSLQMNSKSVQDIILIINYYLRKKTYRTLSFELRKWGQRSYHVSGELEHLIRFVRMNFCNLCNQHPVHITLRD